MSLPRPIIPGSVYLVTRRVSRRKFLLKPSSEINKNIEFLLASVAKRTGVQIHAVTVLSNHWHCVVSDPEGRIPDFLRDVHALIARYVNSARNRKENLWSSEQTSLVRLEGPEDILDKIVYTMANPVSSRLVARGNLWPGLRTCWPAARETLKRPSRFFRSSGPTPEEAQLELIRPPGFDHISNRELAALIDGAIERAEEKLRKYFEVSGKRFVGRRQILRQRPGDSPRSPGKPSGIAPRIAAKDRCRRAEALRRFQEFVSSYREAYRQWRRGVMNALFPAGTYLLRVQANVRCAPS